MKEDHRQQTWLDETLKLLPRDVVVARRSRNREKKKGERDVGIVNSIVGAER